MRRLIGLQKLVHDAVEVTTDLVQETQESIADKALRVLSVVPPLGSAARAVDGARRLSSATVFHAIRVINRGVQVAGSAGLSLLAEPPPAASEGGTPAPRAATFAADAAQAALNAVVGDFLARRGNELGFTMSLMHEGQPLEPDQGALERALPLATAKVCVFVHGLGGTERDWSPFAERVRGPGEAGRPDASLTAGGDRFGDRIEADLGYTSLHVRYNSGLHISDNGKSLARLLTALVQSYPTELEELVLVGHSMGGLVARSAAHYGAESRAPWVSRLTHLFCIGSPHLGAPLEKAGNIVSSVLRLFDVPGTQIPARVLDARSAGIKDLRFGYLVEEDWRDRDADAFLEDRRSDVAMLGSVRHCAITACVTRDPNHPVGRLLGDLLVRSASGTGATPEPQNRMQFEVGSTIGGVHHVALTSHPAVYAQLRAELERPRPSGD